ncbi:hypothetical protein DFH08DRAFT_1082537 [Mycena albidolilacea]|uniref:Uncharacterized protein n=1 Tax=Mycena albidolilacea TaxID=1033008 RepID=A0AAD6ZTF4_9AGAR|nr:hypothetical protein DFH08DRAFT_1082537 [Mycena albidolilacea]
MSTTAPAAVSIPASNHFTTIGSLEIGIINALFLSGISTVQVFLYFRRHRNDGWGIRIVVGLCGALDILHNIALCHTLYTVTVTKHGNPEALLIPPFSLGITILLSGFTPLCSESVASHTPLTSYRLNSRDRFSKVIDTSSNFVRDSRPHASMMAQMECRRCSRLPPRPQLTVCTRTRISWTSRSTRYLD